MVVVAAVVVVAVVVVLVLVLVLVVLAFRGYDCTVITATKTSLAPFRCTHVHTCDIELGVTCGQ